MDTSTRLKELQTRSAQLADDIEGFLYDPSIVCVTHDNSWLAGKRMAYGLVAARALKDYASELRQPPTLTDDEAAQEACDRG